MIPYSTQSIDDDDISAVCEVLRGGILTQGEKVAEFEEALARYLGVKFVCVCNSATSALHIAYKILEIPHSKALTTALTFCATSNMLLENAIEPVFCPCDSLGNLNAESLEKCLCDGVKMVVSVDYGGNSVEAEQIARFCKAHNLFFVADSSHALGGELNGRKVGQFADMTIFSFHAIKPITTMEGGAIATNNEDFYRRAKSLCSHALRKTRLWESELTRVGYNYRLSDVACALGLSQLKKLDFFIAQRHKIARFYDEFFAPSELISTLKIPHYVKSTHHLYPILLHRRLWAHKEAIFRALLADGIGVQVHYKPLYQYALYRAHKPLPSVDSFYNSEISIPCHQKLDMASAESIAKSVIRAVERVV